MPLPLLDLPAAPYEAGLRHGEAAAGLIDENLRTYFDRFQREAFLPAGEVRRRASHYLNVIRRDHPDYAETMRGVADAAGISLIDIAVLNARYELIYSQYSAIGQEQGAVHPSGGCTAFAVLPEAAADGHLWLGQNWDWFPQVRGVLLRQQLDDGRTVVAFTEAGIVGGKIGMNSSGLGLVINGLLSDRDEWSRLRTPFHVRTWRVLHATTMLQAVAAVTEEERSCSANFLIGHAVDGGIVIDVEAAPHGVCHLEPRRGILGHANHFENPEPLGITQPLMEERTSTYSRGARIWHLLEEGREAGRLGREGLMAILRDHEGGWESICRHPNMDWPEEWRIATVVSVLEDLTARRLYVAAGPPCEVPYDTIPLD